MFSKRILLSVCLTVLVLAQVALITIPASAESSTAKLDVSLLTLSDVCREIVEFAIPESAHVSAEGGWSCWRYASISPDGSTLALIVPKRRAVVAVRLDSLTARIVAPHTDEGAVAFLFTHEELTSFDDRVLTPLTDTGRNPGSVKLPYAVAYAHNGDLFISDVANHRVLHYDGGSRFHSSFLLVDHMNGPNDMALLGDRSILVTDLRPDPEGILNSGLYGHIFSSDGRLMRSFAPTPQLAFERRLWTGVDAHCAVADDDRILVAFSITGEITEYDARGTLIGRVARAPEWFIEPPSLPIPEAGESHPPESFSRSWTPLVGLFAVGNGRLLRVVLANHLVHEADTRFVCDLVDLNGNVLIPSLVTDDVPVGADREGRLYFLSGDGSHVLRAILMEELSGDENH